MNKRRTVAAAAIMVLAGALAGCGGSDAPGAISQAEADALNEAAEMLDANSAGTNAVEVELVEDNASPTS